MPIANLTKIIDPTKPNMSILIYRFESTNMSVMMPAIGTEMLDTSAQTTLRDWITNM